MERKQTDSWIWKFILSLRLVAKELLGCDIGDGHSSIFWFDNWTDFGPLIDYIGANGPPSLGISLTAKVDGETSAQH